MNESDSEIINSILKNNGYELSKSIEDADIVLINTCAIRENAENKIWNRLQDIKGMKNSQKNNLRNKKLITGVLGCMAERLKEKLIEKNKIVDLIVGPDAYRSLPTLIQAIQVNKINKNL